PHFTPYEIVIYTAGTCITTACTAEGATTAYVHVPTPHQRATQVVEGRSAAQFYERDYKARPWRKRLFVGRFHGDIALYGGRSYETHPLEWSPFVALLHPLRHNEAGPQGDEATSAWMLALQ
ncbi:unnamed protein product, partial [Ectocarpus sp. 4 AP-2014]